MSFYRIEQLSYLIFSIPFSYTNMNKTSKSTTILNDLFKGWKRLSIIFYCNGFIIIIISLKFLSHDQIYHGFYNNIFLSFQSSKTSSSLRNSIFCNSYYVYNIIILSIDLDLDSKISTSKRDPFFGIYMFSSRLC